MNKTHKHVRITSVILAAIMLISTLCVAGTASAGAASSSKVSMYSAEITFCKYGMTTFNVYIKTKDNCSGQKVTVHYHYYDGEWMDAKAKYVRRDTDGVSKIWKATFTSYDCKYIIKFVSGGKTYYDKNNGLKFTRENLLGSAPIAAERQSSGYFHIYNGSYGGYRIGALLKNYAFEKNVYVKYTTDGWRTSKKKALSYTQTNTDGSETWRTEVMLTSKVDYKDFQYCICYKVNGKEYWANNFGANYDGTFYSYP